jgi:hypothetical protein
MVVAPPRKLIPDYWSKDLYEYARFDTQILARMMKPEPYVSTNYFAQGSWLDNQRNKAELEAHRERVRQVFARSFSAAKGSAEWAQGLVYIQDATTVDKLKDVCNSFDIVWRDQGDMLTKNEELAKLKVEAEKLRVKIEKLEYGRMGKEPANGTVFKIERRFEQFGKGYTYAAVRADGMWYITGTRGEALSSMTWERLKTWVGKYSRVWVMTAREELVD